MGIINPSSGVSLRKLIARAILGASQTIPAGDVPLVLNFGDTVLNDGFSFDGSTITINKAGQYFVNLKARFNSTATPNLSIGYTLNGVNINFTTLTTSPGAVGVYAATASVALDLSVNDTISFFVICSDGGGTKIVPNGNESQRCEFSIIEI